MTARDDAIRVMDIYAEAVAGARVAGVQADLDEAEAVIVQRDATIQHLDEEMVFLTDEVARLQAELDTYRPRLRVGAAAAQPLAGGKADYTFAVWQRLNERAGGLMTARRSFPAPGKQTVDAIAQAHDAALVAFVSNKTPVAASDIAATANAMTAADRFTVNHEFEDDGRSAEFKALYLPVFDKFVAANPKARMGPVANGFAYRHPQGGVGLAKNNTGPLEPVSAWDPGPGKRDFAALDIYPPKPAVGGLLKDNPAFVQWYAYWSKQKGDDGKLLPLILAEYGQLAVAPGTSPTAEQNQRKADLIRQDMAWLRAECPNIVEVYYYDAVGPNGDWRLTGPALDAWTEVAEAGRR